MGKEKKEKKKDREAGAASEADVTMDTTATEVRRILQFCTFHQFNYLLARCYYLD
jgi:hypothetical protein